MAFPAFFDTCTLYGSTLNDLLLWLAEGGAFRPLWSEGVTRELRKNLVEAGHAPALIDKRLGTMRAVFPDAMVDGYDELIDGMTCDEKDRHVLAAAVRANAEVLVTFNVKDFPSGSVDAYEIEIVHPDVFLLDQLDLYPRLTLDTVRRLVEIYDAPSVSVNELLEMLDRSGVPRFVEEIRRFL
jgi:predicted nucleic acid-binding protein